MNQSYVDELSKIDVIRERTGVNYEKARDALQEATGDVVGAIVYLEKMEKKQWWVVNSSELFAKVKELIKAGNARIIRIKHKNKVVLEIPLTAGVIGAMTSAVLVPYLTAAALIAGWYTKWRVEIEKR